MAEQPVFRQSLWSAQQHPVVAKGGMVAAKMPEAARAGASILASGGNAIDAAVATAFAVGVCEPFMNGLGGGGYMVVWLEDEGKSLVIDFPMISASAATPDMFELADNGGTGDAFLFGWPTVKNNANVVGYDSIAVPGSVDGLAMALEKYGTMSLSEVLGPAIKLAEDGYAINWMSTLMQAIYLPLLKMFPATVDAFLNADGNPLVTIDQTNPKIHTQPDLAKTLRRLAKHGARDFYEGEIGATIAADLARNGSRITAEDLANYRAIEREPLIIDYHGHQVHTIGRGTGGLSVGEALTMMNLLPAVDPTERSAADLNMMAQVFQQAFADRFAYLADPDAVEVPEATLVSETYAASRIARMTPNAMTPPEAGHRETLGVSHSMEPSVPEYVQTRSSSTTHLSTVDKQGNAVSMTHTLLGLYGSAVVIPGTGVLMNNGMMWFDPEPGRPNSVGGWKRPLSNMAPIIITKDQHLVASLGSSGGRKIQNCNAQLVMNMVDGNLSAQEAIDLPKIDASSTQLAVSSRYPSEIIEGLKEVGQPVSVRDEAMLTYDFASPVAIRRSSEGTLDGGADQWYFTATVVGVD